MSFVSGVVDGQLGAQVVDVGIRSVLQQDVDTVWVPRTCSIVQDAVTIRRLGVYISTFFLNVKNRNKIISEQERDFSNWFQNTEMKSVGR